MRHFLILCLLLAGAPAFANERRVAVLVGANGAVNGRQALRFAESDAQSMADVLEQVGRFAKEDVLVAKNPTPAELWTVLDQANARLQGVSDGLIFFYFSGHADDKAIYTHGEPADVETLRHKLEASGAQIRIGFLDACYGGAWTRSKGLSIEAPFEVHTPIDTGASGSVLISSSTGEESAHESDALTGSFFTHHFVAGLRGAADASGDGEITLAEAFAYAKSLTIRDTSEQAPSPQHPSFDINLHGRRDIVLAQVASGPTTLKVKEAHGPLQLIHLSSGLIVLEIEPGKRHVTLALPAGRYVLKRAADEGNYAREIELVAGHTVSIDEADLRLVSTETLALKRPEPLPLYTYSTLPKGKWEIDASLAISYVQSTGIPINTGGVALSGLAFLLLPGYSAPSSVTFASTSQFQLTFNTPTFWGITDRLQYKVGTASFAYRFGERGGIELIPHGGLTNWGWTAGSQYDQLWFELGAGLDARFWLGQQQSFILGVNGWSLGWVGTKSVGSTGAHDGSAAARLTYTVTLKDIVTFNLAVLTDRYFYDQNVASNTTSFQRLWIGGVGAVGDRSLPLIQLEVSKHFAIDLNASVLWIQHQQAQATYQGGFTATF